MNDSNIVVKKQNSSSSWNAWNQVFVILDGAARISYIQVSDKKAKKVLMDVHIALKAVNKEFLQVIEAINNGEDIPAIILPPVEISDWDTPGLGGGIIELVQSAVTIIIEEASKHSQTDIMQKVLHTLKGLLDAFEVYKKGVESTNNNILSFL